MSFAMLFPSTIALLIEFVRFQILLIDLEVFPNRNVIAKTPSLMNNISKLSSNCVKITDL